MVGFLYDPTIGEEEEEFNQASELKKSNYPLDLSLPELDDFSLSLAESFLDFEGIKDWIEENPDPYSMTDLKPDPDRVDSVKVEFGAVEERIEMAEDGSCKETTVEDPVGGGSVKLEKVDCFIEEEMEKVSLEGMSDGSAIVDANGKKSGEVVGVNGNNVKSSEIATGNCDGAKSGELVGVDGNSVKSGEVVTVDRNGVEIGGILNGNGVKDGEIASDGDESDSDSESERASSSSSSSSSSCSSKDDDDDDEESGEEEEKKEEEEEEMDVEEGEIRDCDGKEMVAWSDDEDDGDGIVLKGPIKSKNELKHLPPVPAVDVTLQPYHQTLPVGVVLSIIGAQVIVEGVEKHNPLSECSILWITESRSPLGLIDEIFGPVKNPYYVVRYNSDSEVPAGIRQGTLISFVPEFANHVLNDNNLYKKGYDASGENDEELSDEIEFSDDEKEAEYKRMMKMTKRGTNDQKVGSRKMDNKKFKNRGGNWKNDKASATQAQAGVSQLPPDENQRFIPPVAAPHDHGNCSRSSAPGKGFTGGPGWAPPFPQMAQAPGFLAPSNGVWTTGIPTQQPQSMGFPNVFPTNGMLWPQQNHPQHPYQMPLPNGVPFQQQFDTNQRLPSNFVLPGGQSNFCAGPAFAPWPVCMGQSVFNQSPFGMGLQGQHAHPSMNMGEQGVPQMEHNCDLRPPSVVSGNAEASQNFNRGMNFSCGKKTYHRGAGRFGGRRGREQPK